MPIVIGTQNAKVRCANIAMASAFFQRSKDWLYKKLTDAYTSTSLVEPFAMIGSAPPMELFQGKLKLRTVPSFTMQVPNLLYKSALKIAQTDLEGDQTGTVIKLSSAVGLRLAEFPDMLFARRLLTASVANSQYQTFQGVTYTTTFDAQPFFSSSHNDWYSGGTQSNIIQGYLPNTEAGVAAQDLAVTANQLVKDLQLVISAIKKVRDTSGIPFYPTLDPKTSIVVVGPPCLEPAFQLAFRTAGTIGGTNGGSSGATTNVAPMFVKDCYTHGYLAGIRDPESASGAMLTPVNPTDYYIFVTNDYVKPFYVQNFRPLKESEFFPPGYNPEAEVDRILKANSAISVDAATQFASTRVDTTFGRIGANADEYTIVNDNFLVSARFRGNITYGPWFTGWRVKCASGS